jgi:AcrR family transcriptional regulator
MTETPPGRRRRAPALDVEQRRLLIIEAALPLLLQHGTTVSTSTIAQAAGIAEGTVFRAFKDKDELISACAFAALRPDVPISRIQALPPGLGLRDRLLAIADITGEHLERTTRLLQALEATGAHLRPPAPPVPSGTGRAPSWPENSPPTPQEPHQAMARLAEAVADALRPDADRLRISCELTARNFLGMQFLNRTQARLWGGEPLPPTQVVDLFLDGFGDQEPGTPQSPASSTARPEPEAGQR